MLEWFFSNKIKSLFFLAILIGGFNFYSNHQFGSSQVEAYASSLSAGPIQVNQVEDSFPFWKNKQFIIKPLASFELTALALSKEHYRIDTESALAEYDFLFAWGRMADADVIKDMSFNQTGRFGYWSWSSKPSIPINEIGSSIANMHLIPASSAIASELADLKIGQVVQLKGKLVSVTGAGGYKWTSSLSRTDAGRGACEVFYVEYIGI